MAKVGSVTMEMIADIGSFTRNINKAVNETNSAVRKIQSSFTGLQNFALGLGAGFSIGQIIQEAAQSELAFKQLEATIRATGGAAGVSASELGELSTQLQQTSTFSDEAIQNMESLLLTFTNIGGETIPRATQAIVDLSTKLGVDLNSAAMKVGKALNDPVNGLTSLSKMGVTFTEQQKKVIEQLVHTGHAAEAQAMVLEKLEGKFAGAAAAARDTLDGALKSLSMSFGDLLEKIGLDNSSGLRYGVELLITGFQTLTRHSKELENGLLALAVAAGALSSAQLIGFLGRATTGMLAFARSIHPAVAALTLAAGSVVLFRDEIAKVKIPDWLYGKGIKNIGDALNFEGQQSWKAFQEKFPEVSQILSDTNGRMQSLAEMSKKTGTAIAVDFGDAVEKSKHKVKSLKQQMDELFQKDYQEGINNMIAAQKALDEQLKSAVQGMLSPWDQYVQNVGKLMELAKQFPQNAADMAFAMRNLTREYAQSSPEVQKLNEEVKKLERAFGDSMEATIKNGDEMRKQAAETIDMLDQKMADMEKGFFTLGDSAKQLSSNIVTAFDQAIFSGKNLTDVVKNLGMAILRIAEQQFILNPLQKFISGIPGMLGGAFSGLGSSAPAPLSAMHGLMTLGGGMLPQLASGGSLSAGEASIVGERGPELFVPKVNGNVLPNSALSLGGTNRMTVNVNVINQTNSRIVQQRTVNPDGSEDVNIMIVKAVANAFSSGDPELIRAVKQSRSVGRF